MLIDESRVTPTYTSSRRCTVTKGRWYSYYDGITWTNPSDVDIDHVVALKEAWESGARRWSSTSRTRFVAVTAPVVTGLQAALDVRSLQVRTIGAWAQERALGRLLSRVLPQPYAIAVRALAGVLLLPRVLREELVNAVQQLLLRVLSCPSPSTAGTTTMGPACAPAAASTSSGQPSASQKAQSAAPRAVSGIDWQALAADVDASEGPDPSTSRCSAGNASNKRGANRRR